MPTRPLGAFLLLAAFTAGAMLGAASAARAAPPTIQVENAWIPQPPPGAQVAAAYLTLRNTGRMAVFLVGVSSPVASNAMVHRTMVMNGESMMMPVERLAVAPGQTVTLKPDAMHVMLDGLHGPLKVGQQVPLVLRFAGGAEIHVSALVRPLGSQ
jgi:periplasmic copper chaperone A